MHRIWLFTRLFIPNISGRSRFCPFFVCRDCYRGCLECRESHRRSRRPRHRLHRHRRGRAHCAHYVSSNYRWASYLEIQYIPRVGELTVFCGALVGASLGFLWYNAHPAEVFMGDVGSLSLGGTLGVIAVIIKQEVLLFFVGGVLSSKRSA